MLNLILTIFCSTSIALILKFNDSNKGNTLVLLAGNYFFASIVSFLLIIIDGSINFHFPSLLFGSILGLFFVLSFFSFAKAVSIAGTSLATVSSRLSVIVPVLLSIIIYNDIPNLIQICGLLLAILTIILFYLSIRSDKNSEIKLRDYFYLFAVLIGIGLSDFGMKIFQNWRPLEEKNVFLMSIFFFAFLYTTGYLVFTKQKFEKNTFAFGMLLGIPNLFSSYFLIGALTAFPAFIVYPTANLGIIIFTTILAYFIWKEIPNRFGKIALLTGIIAIVFISL